MIDYDPFAPQIQEDPHPTYRALRDRAPAYYLPRFDAWALSRFEDVWTASADPMFSTARGTAPAQLLTREQPVTPMLNCLDPPEHTRLRAELARCFQPVFVTRLESQALQLVEAILDRAAATGVLEVVNELGSELAVAISCLAVGMHSGDGPAVAALIRRFFRHEPQAQGITADGLLALGELQALCADRIRERRRRPPIGADALSVLAHFTAGKGRRFEELEAGSHAAMLLIGGCETFPKVLANGALRLWQHPDQRLLLVRDPTRIAGAFDEIVRYDMPTQFLCRRLLKDFSLHGEELLAGQSVILLYASANRDDREFESADAFDVTRSPSRVLSFGAGIHRCIGRHIAAMEGRIALSALLRRYPDYHVDLSRSARAHTEFVQGFSSLPIELGRAAAGSAARHP
jgi:cytochrome P450